jgi:hypothetical protein
MTTVGTTIGVAGDWHSNISWALRALSFLNAQGIKQVLHVGDFAIDFQNNNACFSEPINNYLVANGMMIFVTPGNHENWETINRLPVIKEGEFAGWATFFSNILIAPRGLRWSWHGVSFVSLGGANSIDRASRIQGITWWAEESITWGDYHNVAAGGHADVMIAHAAPFSAKYNFNSGGWPQSAIIYSDETRLVLGMVVDEVQPELFFHGHYHVAKIQKSHIKAETGEVYTTKFVSLARDDDRDNLASFNLNTKKVEFLGNVPE